MELQGPSEKGSLLIDGGTQHKQPRVHTQKYTNSLPSVCMKVMIMSYERL